MKIKQVLEYLSSFLSLNNKYSTYLMYMLYNITLEQLKNR